ncbi:cytoplasmic dynein intermediate chain, putative [Plasmodium berghei]|uniref:Cytoplasmic dynein intermediate chain, putative n=2 Tax=Plasmodium berghei TaxID=5821 RepID=A0A509AFK2_PLABA|nr:cytoplasmic dynein intermediate chain, putative [Plasmodium berghei ANKA]CXI07610.1 cytoplasmic dynein intermediate chain, putative [Plasmodium berghei]SCL92631.1 cytoplasmic dynein intermediate chain, putative [Plasmodium berghei]SCM15681.1 cytoplasmic dynein intermediate chain, putative [Plasmodium berghei]SCM17475.1 cytoplasmic dynein intermediate chain, putative [Plasmodium berghei]SCN22842.1 cytoplasmic dynein intermediate chain, putative [Plasmodium berghei]|eukprot:XP_034420286.1 cytoplasmic dynein intermediate chain, putative [Plasmodium berghei ANKA]
MDSDVEYDILKPIDEEERIRLQNKLNEQRIELEKKKIYLEELKKFNENGILNDNKMTNVEEIPDPDEMVKKFIDELEKEQDDDEINLKDQIKDNSNIKYIETHRINRNAKSDMFHVKPRSIEEYVDKSFLFKKKASVKNFNFKINKMNEEKCIHIEKKMIKNFDKSVQVDIIFEKDENNLDTKNNMKRNIKSLYEKTRGCQIKLTEKEKISDNKIENEKNKEEKKSKKIEQNIQNNIIKSKSFNQFIEKCSKIIERYIGEQEMFNATLNFDTNKFKNQSKDSENWEKLKLINNYYCKTYTNNRPITDIKTCNIYSELFLASYGASETSTYNDPDGYVLVWNSLMTNRPEYTLISQSPVCTCLFNKFNPYIVIGGTYTGNILLWDIRINQKKSIHKTILSSQGHLHPIYCAEIIGTQNSHNLISVDTDGRLCNWSLNMLTYPSDIVDLKKINKEISCSCFSFQEGEINTLYGGTEDGSIFQAQIHGNKTGITESYNIHNGPLTSIQFHPFIEGMEDNNDLILTSSVDWSCKLLSIKNPENILFTFDGFDDYIMDVKWNPAHPGIFATCTSNSKIQLWNISNDIENYYFETILNVNAVNKIAWSHDGKKLIAADSNGYLTLWNASNDIYQPRSDEIAKFDKQIEKLKSNYTEFDIPELEPI